MTTLIRPYQFEGADHLASSKQAMLADDAGLGKSLQAIKALDIDEVEGPVIIVSTSSSLYSWQREVNRWQTVPRRVEVITDTKLTARNLPSADVFITGYSQLSLISTTLRTLLRLQPRAVILDEAHYLKEPGAKRTQAAYTGLTDKWQGTVPALKDTAEYLFALTATPAPNHYGELFTHLRALAPDRLKALGLITYDSFQRRYCAGFEGTYGFRVTGSKNTTELRDLIKGVILRRTKKQVLPELPELVFDTLPVPAGAVTAQIRSVLGALQAKLREEGYDPDNIQVQDLRRSEVATSTERRALGMLKVDAVVNHVTEDLTENKRKILLFAHHHDVLDALYANLAAFEPVLVKGGLTPAQRQSLIDRFQENPNCRLFIGQNKAAGESITLTEANKVLLVEPSWTPDDNYQCACRAHRIGQHDSVLTQLVTIQGTLDDDIGQALALKAQMTADLFN